MENFGYYKYTSKAQTDLNDNPVANNNFNQLECYNIPKINLLNNKILRIASKTNFLTILVIKCYLIARDIFKLHLDNIILTVNN